MKRIKVLVIDDSPIVRDVLTEGLNLDPHIEVVGTAIDPYMAREKIAKLRPDVLTLDIEMPRMNGLELLAKIQQDKRLSQIPVAMVTSRGAEKHRKIAAELGAKAYFTKPYLEDELLKAAESLIAGTALI